MPGSQGDGRREGGRGGEKKDGREGRREGGKGEGGERGREGGREGGGKVLQILTSSLREKLRACGREDRTEREEQVSRREEGERRCLWLVRETMYSGGGGRGRPKELW